LNEASGSQKLPLFFSSPLTPLHKMERGNIGTNLNIEKRIRELMELFS
jgi:hypothetical protein